MVRSKTRGKFYATIKEASVTTTFDAAMCESLIGTQMSGCIKRVECEAYEYADKKTGEILTLHHRWEYAEEGETAEENIFNGEVIGAEA